MVTYGTTLCESAVPPGDESGVWYYDGARVFDQIASYTSDTTWDACRAKLALQYRSWVLGGADVGGWQTFTTGLRLDDEHAESADDKAAIVQLSNAKFCADSVPATTYENEGYSREVAYCIHAILDDQAIEGVDRSQTLTRLVEAALGHLDQWFVARSSPNTAPFMFGLTAEALIRYHDAVNQDPRILSGIQSGLDWIWLNAWVSSSQAFWYRLDSQTPAPDLNLLIAPAFAWVYQQTCDSSYLEQGDQVWAGGVTGAYISDGKHFSQNYRWSFQYLNWRGR
jgi:hypothetical protein